MKTVYIGKESDYDVVYEMVTHVREIENACGAKDTAAPKALISNGNTLLSDAMFSYKNSRDALHLSAKQISTKFVSDIRSQLSKLNHQSANDSKIFQYHKNLENYLEELDQIQNELVDIPEWHECRDALLERIKPIDIKKYPSAVFIPSFCVAMDRANTSQAEKFHHTLEMIVKSYLAIKKQNSKEMQDKNDLLIAIKHFLENDLQVDLSSIDKNSRSNIVNIRMQDPSITKAFTKAYGELKISRA